MSDQTTEKAFESYLEETLINKSGWKHRIRGHHTYLLEISKVRRGALLMT